jgi:tetratricopeptide (TPR) repeat protein
VGTSLRAVPIFFAPLGYDSTGMRPQPVLLAALLAAAFAAPALGDDAADCAGSDPAKVIAACTRIVGAAGAPVPKVADAYSKRGIQFALQGDYEKALADLGEAIRLDPKGAAESYHTRGRIYADQGRADAAIAEFDAAINADAGHADALISRGSLRFLAARGADGKFNKRAVDAAMADLGKAVEVSPKYAEAYIARGGAYLATSRLPQAVADFDQAVKLEPGNASAYLNRAVALVFQKQFARAEADFGRAAKLEPGNPTVYQERATAFLLQGKKSEAIADYRKVLALDPSHAQARAALKRLGAAP